MQQLHAKIRDDSPYYHEQMPMAKNNPAWGWPFPVVIKQQPRTKDRDFIVEGGPGGCYTLADVNLFVIDQNNEIQIL
jgi:hypothetical protein